MRLLHCHSYQALLAETLLMQYIQWPKNCSCVTYNCHWLNFNSFCGVGGPMRRIEMLKTSSFRSDLSSSSLSPSIADSAMTHQRTSGDNHSPDNSRRNSSMQVASPLGPRPDRQVSCTPIAHLLLVLRQLLFPCYRLHAQLHDAVTSIVALRYTAAVLAKPLSGPASSACCATGVF